MTLPFKLIKIASIFILLDILGMIAVNLLMPNHSVVDTNVSSSSLYMDEPRMVFYGRGPLKTSAQAIYLLGASNVREGFLTERLQPQVPGRAVHNLSIGASNFTQIDQVVDLAYDSSPASPGNKLFVLGCWYGLFVRDEVRWPEGRTDLQNEMLRYGLYQQEETSVQRRLPVWAEHYAVELMKPYLYLNYQYQKLKSRGRIGQNKVGSELERIIITDEMQKEAMRFWGGYMSDYHPGYFSQQYGKLSQLIRKVHDRNDRILIVDMPLPDWHAQASPFYAHYQAMWQRLCDEFPEIELVDLGKYSDAKNYYDSAHPKPSTAVRWSKALAYQLSNYLNKT